MAHRSRWGWYPCDYDTYCHLKKLHTRCWAARRRYAEWQRWQRKQPQNRVIHAWIRDPQGRRIAFRVVGPRPEPVLDPLFTTRAKVVRHWSDDGRHMPEGETMERVAFDDLGVPAAYRAARRPAPTEKEVAPLALKPDAIRQLVTQAEELGQSVT